MATLAPTATPLPSLNTPVKAHSLQPSAQNTPQQHSDNNENVNNNNIVSDISSLTLHNSRPASASQHTAVQSSAQLAKQYVFLGGSCDPTTWRFDVAIPKLTKYNVTYYNPQVSDWNPDLIALEAAAKEQCTVLLFVIDSMTRAIASMLEATEYIMRQRQVVLVILDIAPDTVIDGYPVDNRQLKDLNRARAFLCDIASRHQKYCDVFDSVESAINHIIWNHPNLSPHKKQKSARNSVVDTNVKTAFQIVASPPALIDDDRPKSSK